MSGVRFRAPEFSQLRDAALAERTRETCAIAYAHHDVDAGSWVVADAALVPDDAYERRDADSAVLKTAFVVEVANHARAKGVSVIFIHTHPQAKGPPCFSHVDDAGELGLKAYLSRRAPDGAHLALVIGPDGCRGRQLGGCEEVDVWDVSEHLILRSTAEEPNPRDERHDRQVRAFGTSGQQMLQRLHVGLVGCGGTGSAVAPQLAHLGVAGFTLIDPDLVETTNLNRLVGAGPGDVGLPKVKIAERIIKAINPQALVRTLQADVVDSDIAPQLAGFDAIFLCTDSHASRAVVGQVAYQHLVPVFDMGVSITAREGSVTHITGRVQMLAPRLPCLTCTGALDSEQIRREMLTPEQSAADPYIQGAREPQPAVISINSTMASLAVTMFLGAVTPAPIGARFQYYDGIRGTVRPASASQIEGCIVCSGAGALARGSSWPLPVRPVGARHG